MLRLQVSSHSLSASRKHPPSRPLCPPPGAWRIRRYIEARRISSNVDDTLSRPSDDAVTALQPWASGQRHRSGDGFKASLSPSPSTEPPARRVPSLALRDARPRVCQGPGLDGNASPAACMLETRMGCREGASCVLLFEEGRLPERARSLARRAVSLGSVDGCPPLTASGIGRHLRPPFLWPPCRQRLLPRPLACEAPPTGCESC